VTSRIAGVLIRTGDLRHTHNGTAENFSFYVAAHFGLSREVVRTFEVRCKESNIFKNADDVLA